MKIKWKESKFGGTHSFGATHGRFSFIIEFNEYKPNKTNLYFCSYVEDRREEYISLIREDNRIEIPYSFETATSHLESIEQVLLSRTKQALEDLNKSFNELIT